MTAIKFFLTILMGLGSGLVISGAVFAFIAIIGVVPRIAQKTKTENHIKTYETGIILGGIWGTSCLMLDYRLPIGTPAVVIYMFLVGIFYGCLAFSLAEVLNVIPVLTRRGNLKRGLKYFITALALGKMLGSILYYSVPGFFIE